MIGIIDYGLGNLASIQNALDKLNTNSVISNDPKVLIKCNALIFPGVGAAEQGMNNLKKLKLDKFIIQQAQINKPILGICLGMQLFFEKTEEGGVNCLGIFKGSVTKFKKERKIPQIGWNSVEIVKSNKSSPFVNDIPDKSYFYFVNSYYSNPKDKSIIKGRTTYGEEFASIVIKKNIIGTQFHPEKSGQAGFTMIKNFIVNYVN